MADEARPLSRRERREMEEHAALAETPAESSAPSASGRQARPTAEQVEQVKQDAALSRRDRRRIERLEQPMETWTAVEEMHHTGQVPTMTPEVIAQQEELARRRAAEAQADAVRATGEMHQVGAHQVTPGAVERVTGGEPVISRFDMPDEAPRELAPAPGEPPHASGDEARRRLAQAAAAAAAALPADRERPPVPVHARQEHGVLDAPRPPTSEVPALADLTPPSGVPGARSPVPPGAPVPQEAPPTPPQQVVPGQEELRPPSGAIPNVVPPRGSPIPAPGAAAALPGAAAGQVIPGVPQGAPGSPPPPGFGLPTGVVPAQGAPSPYPPGTALSPVATGTLRPVPGATGTMRAIPGGGPMTGTLPRPVVEVQPAGGAKDFGWPHIAILAAVAFTLGIVVWTISGLGG